MKRGFVWCAWGTPNLRRAAVSAYSAQQQMPDISRILLTTVAEAPPPRHGFAMFTEVHRLNKNAGPNFYRKVRWIEHSLGLGYSQLIYLDADTLVCVPVYDLFNLLEEVSLAYAHAPLRYMRDPPDGVPNAFSEPNAGILVYRVDDTIRKLFKQWRIAFEQWLLDDGIYNDQPVLRALLWKSGIRTAVLPREYNFRFEIDSPVAETIRILHGHHNQIRNVAQYAAGLISPGGLFLAGYEEWRDGRN